MIEIGSYACKYIQEVLFESRRKGGSLNFSTRFFSTRCDRPARIHGRLSIGDFSISGVRDQLIARESRAHGSGLTSFGRSADQRTCFTYPDKS